MTNDIEHAYREHRGVLRRAAFAVYRRYGGELKDWEAEADCQFVALHRSGRVRQTTPAFIYQRTKSRLIDVSRRRYFQLRASKALIPPAEAWDRDIDEGTPLSHDAMSAVCLATSIAWRDREEWGGTSRRDAGDYAWMRRKIKRTLRNRGWSGRRIKRAFKEIREALRD